jgi:phosphoglycerate dehydrogenase-like enzyme
MIRVAILDDYQGVALASADWSPLAGRADVTVVREHHASVGELTAALQGFDVVVGMRERTAFPADVLDRLPRLRLLITTGVRNASFDLAAAAAHGVTVCGTRATGSAAPELTWGLILALTRQIVTEDAAVRAGRWQVAMGRGLAGATLGILGLGRIGERLAKYAEAFDMNVNAWSPNLTAERAEACGARLVGKRELFERSDIVTVHVVLSERSRGLIGVEELGWLGPDGLLVNTSRGPIVDEAALIRALRERTIAGAALDVFDREPLPVDHPLRSLPNTVITPHIGYVTREGYRVFFADVVEDITAWMAGRPVRQLA